MANQVELQAAFERRAWLHRIYCRLGWHGSTIDFNDDVHTFFGGVWRYRFRQCVLCGTLRVIRPVGESAYLDARAASERKSKVQT